jgi:membrane-bound lytic murein transglycosylase B
LAINYSEFILYRMLRLAGAVFVCWNLTAFDANAIDINRPEVHSFIDKMVNDHQLKRSDVEAILQDAVSQQTILDAIAKPAERTIPWFEYRERFLTDKRIKRGVDFAQEHTKLLTTLTEQNAPVSEMLGILGVETMYGDLSGKYRVIDALATLSFDYPPRSTFFIGELEQYLLLAQEQHIVIKDAIGSYAGAMGAPQFMPRSYRTFAVDGNGDGKIDLWTDWNDVLFSVANYLKQYGWHDGEPVMANAEYSPKEAPPYSVGDIALNETIASLKAKGVTFTTSLPDTSPAVLITLQGKNGPEYRVGFNNFYVITRYNRSPLYANAVIELGQAITTELAQATTQPVTTKSP